MADRFIDLERGVFFTLEHGDGKTFLMRKAGGSTAQRVVAVDTGNNTELSSAVDTLHPEESVNAIPKCDLYARFCGTMTKTAA